MKAVTIRQPYASLIAAGVKTVETRPRRTSYRGRVAIHAAKAEDFRHGGLVGDWRCYRADGGGAGKQRGARAWNRTGLADKVLPLPLGAVVASAVLTDCAPIGGPYDFRTGYVEGDEGDYPGQAVVVHHPPMGPMGAYLGLSNADTSTTDITDQLPYGDYRPGRWALLLDDIKPTTDRCPWCWGEGELDDTPQSPGRMAPRFQFVKDCPVCDGDARCDPIPARGQRAVPWEWTP